MTVTPEPTGATPRPAPKPVPTSKAAGQPAGAPAEKPAEPSIGQLVSDASAHVSTLIQGEIALAKLELKSSAINGATGIGLFLGAGVFVVFALIFGFFALAEGFAAMGLSRWLSFLIVFGILLVLAGLFVFVGIKLVKKIKAPKKTIASSKETVQYLKNSRA